MTELTSKQKHILQALAAGYSVPGSGGGRGHANRAAVIYSLERRGLVTKHVTIGARILVTATGLTAEGARVAKEHGLFPSP